MTLVDLETDLTDKFGSTILDEELREDLKDIKFYTRTFDWKMFIPPLPQHEVKIAT